MSADLVIGGVLLPGAAAPKLITEKMVSQMKKGSVIVDVAIDQGGCAETSHATTHADPTYIVDDVVHYCVANMPGAVARTSTFALNNATLPFTLALAEQGAEEAMKANPHLRAGLNVYKGTLTYKAVARSAGPAVQERGKRAGRLIAASSCAVACATLWEWSRQCEYVERIDLPPACRQFHRRIRSRERRSRHARLCATSRCRYFAATSL